MAVARRPGCRFDVGRVPWDVADLVRLELDGSDWVNFGDGPRSWLSVDELRVLASEWGFVPESLPGKVWITEGGRIYCEYHTEPLAGQVRTAGRFFRRLMLHYDGRSDLPR